LLDQRSLNLTVNFTSSFGRLPVQDIAFLLLFIGAIVALALYADSVLITDSLGVLLLSPYIFNFPDYVNHSVFGNGIEYVNIFLTGHISNPAFLPIGVSDIHAGIPGIAILTVALSEITGIPPLDFLPVGNLVMIFLFYLLLPLALYLFLRRHHAVHASYFVLFWALLGSGSVIYEQGLIDHEFATILLAVVIMIIAVAKGRNFVVLSIATITSMIITHPLQSVAVVIAMTAAAVFSKFEVRASKYLLSIVLLAIFITWYIESGLNVAFVLSYVSIVLSARTNYIFHAATSLPMSASVGFADILYSISFALYKGLLGVTLSIFALGFILSIIDLVRSRFLHKLELIDSMMVGVLAIAVIFSEVPSIASYGFADRFLWLLPLVLPASIAGQRLFKQISTRYGRVRWIAVFLIPLTFSSALFVPAVFYYSPQQPLLAESRLLSAAFVPYSYNSPGCVNDANDFLVYARVHTSWYPPLSFAFSLANPISETKGVFRWCTIIAQFPVGEFIMHNSNTTYASTLSPIADTVVSSPDFVLYYNPPR
jgi:hypothetical protein